jgi:hypothetical protein
MTYEKIVEYEQATYSKTNEKVLAFFNGSGTIGYQNGLTTTTTTTLPDPIDKDNVCNFD